MVTTMWRLSAPDARDQVVSISTAFQSRTALTTARPGVSVMMVTCW
jgi:hypothetical protein